MRIRNAVLVAFFVSCFLIRDASAQWNLSVSGFITDAETGEPIPFAHVQFVNPSIPTSCNRFGFYTHSLVSLDTLIIRFSSVGYRTLDTMCVAITQNETFVVNVTLSPVLLQLPQIDIVGQSAFLDTREHPSSLVITKQQLSILPSPGEQDLLRSLQRFPGITFNSELSSSIYVRGGTPDETLILMDGVAVYNPSHVFGFFSMFHPDAVSAVKVMKGGFPAEYGTRNGSVVDIVSVDGNKSNFGGKASLGLVGSGVFVEGPIGRGSLMVAARRSYFDLIKGAVQGIINDFPDYYFYDIHAKITQQVGPRDVVKTWVLLNRDNLIKGNPDLIGGKDEYIKSLWTNSLVSAEWSKTVGTTGFLRTLGSLSSYKGSLDASQNVLLQGLPGQGLRISNFSNELSDFTLKSELEWTLNEAQTINSGFFATLYRVKYSTDASLLANRSEILSKYGLFGMFAQDRISFGEAVSATPGIRLTYVTNQKLPFVEPRLVLSYKISSDLHAKLGTGTYYQWLNGGQPASFLTFSGIDFWYPVDQSIPPSKAFQISGDIIWSFAPSWSFGVSSYLNILSNLVEMRPAFEQANDLSGVFTLGEGKNYGAEFILENSSGAIHCLASYTLSKTSRSFSEVDEGLSFPARHDKRHVVNLLCGVQLGESWNLGLAWVFSTGQAYTGITGYFELIGLGGGGFSGGNTLHFALSKKNQYRLPNYHRLDLNASKTWTYDHWKLRLRIDIFNAYSRFNALGASKGLGPDDFYTLLPIVPTVSVEAEF